MFNQTDVIDAVKLCNAVEETDFVICRRRFNRADKPIGIGVGDMSFDAFNTIDGCNDVLEATRKRDNKFIGVDEESVCG